MLRELSGVLGLRLEAALSDTRGAAPFIELLIALRKELREAKQYALADRIRDGLSKLDIVLEDSPGGTTWKPR
jgi:cysteinyl-tRNA synthetase